jgi:CspA family cold shock protein
MPARDNILSEQT